MGTIFEAFQKLLDADASARALAERREILLATRKPISGEPPDAWGNTRATVPNPRVSVDANQLAAIDVNKYANLPPQGRELAYRQDVLRATRRPPADADRPAMDAQKSLDAVAAAINGHAADVLQALSPEQARFVRDAEFLLYLKELDRLIREFDRGNRFDLQEAIRKTNQALSRLQATAVLRREVLALQVAASPDLPRALFSRLLGQMRNGYIDWRAALDR